MRYNIQHSAKKEQILDDMALLVGHRYERLFQGHDALFMELVSEMRNGGATRSLEMIKDLRDKLFELDSILEDSMKVVSGYISVVAQENSPEPSDVQLNEELEDGEGRLGTYTTSGEDTQAESQ
tara:strand:+ start:178 stop:549 length:372 start_codon:yes stop_codon:yes gene_type:complete